MLFDIFILGFEFYKSRDQLFSVGVASKLEGFEVEVYLGVVVLHLIHTEKFRISRKRNIKNNTKKIQTKPFFMKIKLLLEYRSLISNCSELFIRFSSISLVMLSI